MSLASYIKGSVTEGIVGLQQADVLRKHTSLRVSHFCGDMNVDYWDRRRWGKELQEQDIWVMTPQILLNVLRHGFLKVSHLLLSTPIIHSSLQACCIKSPSCVFCNASCVSIDNAGIEENT